MEDAHDSEQRESCVRNPLGVCRESVDESSSFENPSDLKSVLVGAPQWTLPAPSQVSGRCGMAGT